MVFQNYALYPHMSVRENMGFALKLKGVDKARSTARSEAARVLDLDRTSTASRPALRRPAPARRDGAGDRARAGGFLMDEPLSNLDAKLRVQMRGDLPHPAAARHDDRVRDPRPDRGDDARRPRGGDARGPAQQVGSPMELYDDPVNLFVAGFIGSPAMNFMPATVEGDTVKLPFGDVTLPERAARRRAATTAQAADRGHPARALRGRLARGRRA